jgi:hypothetical protein
MAKVAGTIRVDAHPASSKEAAYFEVVFVPYSGRLDTRPAKITDLDDLVALLMNLKLSEDEATRWAGKARTQGVVLIAGVERTDVQLRENGLLA